MDVQIRVFRSSTSHTIQCPFSLDRQNLRHVQTSQSHFENALLVGHLVGVLKEYYLPMTRNLLLWHCPINAVQLELLKNNVICVENWPAKKVLKSVLKSVLKWFWILIKEQSLNHPPIKIINWCVLIKNPNWFEGRVSVRRFPFRFFSLNA